MKFPKSLPVFLFVSIAVISFFASALYTDTIKAALWSVNDFDSLSFDSITQTSVHLSWTLSQVNGGSQSIYRNSVYITSVAVGTSGYTSSGLSCGTTFSYDVCSVYGCASNSVTTTVCPPAAPTGLTATAVSQTQINLSWNAVSGATSYDVYKAGVLIGNTVNTGFYTVGLNCNTSYNYTVRAKNVSGDSLDSNPASATTDQCTPGTPTIGTATCTSQTAATVTWTRNSPLTESGFNIYSSGGPYRGSAGAGATSGTASGLVASTPYAFNVEAYVTTNGRTYYSARSANSNACTTLPNPPAAPTGLTATAVSQTSISLSWTASSGATGYNVYRGGDLYIGSTSGTSYSDTGLPCDTLYNYTVVAYNAGGNSSASSPSNAVMTDQCTPGTPTIGSASPTGQTTASVSWTRTFPYTESGFGIYIISDNPPTTIRGTAGVGATSGTASGLVANTSYSFYVYSYVTTNGRTYYSNSSAASNSITTLPNPPAAPTLSGTTISQTQINLSWTAPSGATSYTLSRTGYGVVYSGNATSYSDIGLSCGTSYSYTVTATNSGGTSSNSNIISQTTSACNTAPNTPTLTSPPNGSWTTSPVWCATVSDPDGNSVFAMFYDIGTGGAISGNTVASGGSSCFTGAVDWSGTWYARAVDSPGGLYSGNSATWTAYVDITAPTPNPPIVSASAASQTSLNASMSAGSDSYSGLAASPYGFSTNGSTYTWYASNSQTLSGLSCGTAYTVYGKIKDAVGNMTNVGTASASTSACNIAPNMPTPTSPANNSWVTSRQFCATVSDPDGGNVTAKFVIGGTTYTGSTVTSGNNSCYTHIADLNGTTWYVYAQDPQGATSGNSATWTANIDTAAPAPNPPTVSASAASQTSLNVSMSAGTDGASGLHATAYGFSTNGSTYTWYASNSQTLSSLTCGTNYTVYGKIKDAVGNMTSAGTTSATTDSCVVAPSAISSFLTLKETSGGGGFGATWSAAGGADGYNVYIKGGRTNPTNAIKVGGDISGTLLTQSLQGECPSSYTVSILAYATDASLGGATDSSCDSTFSNAALSGATTPIGRKCSTLLTQTLILKSCTGGFLLE